MNKFEDTCVKVLSGILSNPNLDLITNVDSNCILNKDYIVDMAIEYSKILIKKLDSGEKNER